MSKYYTPNIEEFHVGFEYEITTTSVGMCIMDFSKNPAEVKQLTEYPTPIWEESEVRFDQTFGYNNKLYRNIESLNNLLKDKKIRVKLLDKEDIENLGWVCQGGQMISDGKAYFVDKKEIIGITLRPNFFEDGHASVHIYELTTDVRIGSIMFSGKIKNKTEFNSIINKIDVY